MSIPFEELTTQEKANLIALSELVGRAEQDILLSIKRGQLAEVRSCCHPENLIGYLPPDIANANGIEFHEWDDGSMALNCDHREDFARSLPGFIEAGPKTRRK